jgi:PTH1 family peptidyl-tRNA hydrolase
MKLIVGLGNPGREYEATRHNVGWWVVDHLADAWRFEGWRKDGQTLVTSGTVADQRVRLMKPLTYMNLSGSVLRPYLRKDGWSARTDLLIVVDEVALPVGRVRLRASGSAGGHNGLKSIEQALGHQEYARLRIGIRPEDPRRVGNLADFVLSPFGRDDRELTLALLPRVRDALEVWIRGDLTAAMNDLNRQP